MGGTQHQSTDLVFLRGKRLFGPCPLFWYLLGVLLKISDDHPCHFYMGFPPSPAGLRKSSGIDCKQSLSG